MIGDEPQIRLRDSDEIADAAIPLAYLQQYISDAVIEKKETAEVIGRALNEEDLKRICANNISNMDFSRRRCEETWNSFAIRNV